MLEIRYNTITKEVTGWWGDRHGNHEVKLKDRPNEAMAMLDIGIPNKPLAAWLYDGKKLVPNPDYIEPKPPRDLATEIDDLRAEIQELKLR
ncbi:unnamed protein product [marine sediment metagenome]|uniref:Uncharacterized protein n=1 Tax=marine sediment metagenome TaxID=412755 RepID=X1BSR4_9ZZZZ